MKLIEGTITYPTAGEYNDLIDGSYEKTVYVKTWEGKTITAEISLEQTTKIVKKRIEAKTGIPTDDQQLVAREKVLTDNIPLKEYGISEGETIEMTAKLLGGTKHKSLSPKPMDTERDKKKEKNLNHTSTWKVLKVKSHRQILTKAKKWMSEADEGSTK